MQNSKITLKVLERKKIFSVVLCHREEIIILLIILVGRGRKVEGDTGKF